MRPVIAIAAAAGLLTAAPAAQAVEWSRAQVVTRSVVPESRPDVAVNRRGESLVAYRTPAGRGHYGDALEVVRRGRDGRLGEPQRIGRGMVTGFAVALADDGRAFAIWEREQLENDLAHTVLLAEAPPGGRFGRPRIVEDECCSSPQDFSLATAAGRAVAVYGDRYSISVLARGPGGRFGERVRLSSGIPDLAMNERGEAFVSWLDGEEIVSVPVRDGVVGERRAVPVAGEKGYLRTGLGAAGTLVLSWQGMPQEMFGFDRFFGPLHARTVPASGEPTPVVDVLTAPRSDREGAHHPELAVARDGSGVAVYHRIRWPGHNTYPVLGRVFAARLTPAGRRPRPPQPLSARSRVSTWPRVATDRRGRTVAVWQEVRKDSLDRPARLMAAAAGRGGPFGRPRALASPVQESPGYTLAAGGGRFVVAYQRQIGEKRFALAVREGR